MCRGLIHTNVNEMENYSTEKIPSRFEEKQFWNVYLGKLADGVGLLASWYKSVILGQNNPSVLIDFIFILS